MVQITEFRIPMPLNLEEYQRGQLHGIAVLSYVPSILCTNCFSKESSQSNGEGVEVLKNEPFDDNNGKGQYTKKIYHVGSSLPTFVSMIIPSGALDVYEVCYVSIILIVIGGMVSVSIL